MRAVRNAKRVAVVLGGTLVLAGCLGTWLAAMLQAGPGDGRAVVGALFFSFFAVIQGVLVLSWDRRSRPMVLMRAQASDAVPAILPLVVVGSAFLSVPEFADPANPTVWMVALLVGSAAISVVPEEKAALAEIPPLRRGGLLNWLRWQNFGVGTLLLAIMFPLMFFSYPLPFDAFSLMILVLALAQATLSVWRIMEHRQMSRAGVRLSGLQINWLRIIHVNRGHEAAVKELRTMYPKISPMHADTIIENLYRAKEEPPDIE